MIWLKDLYIGESARPRIQKILKAAEADKPPKKESALLIILSLHPKAQLDIVSLKEIHHAIYADASLMVLGAAGNKKEALSLVERITADCLKASGAPFLKEYFATREFVPRKEVVL